MWREERGWNNQNLLEGQRENVLMSHKAQQGDSPSPATLEDHKKEGDFFAGTKKGWSVGGSGPASRMEELTNVDGTVQVRPKAPCNKYLLLHTPQSWEAWLPSTKGSKGTMKLLPPNTSQPPGQCPLSSGYHMAWNWQLHSLFPMSLFSSVAQSCPTLCNPMDCSTPRLSVHHQLPEFTQTHVHWIDDAIQPSHPLLSPSLLPSIFPSIRLFSNESALLIRWPKYWSFSFNISPSNEHSGLTSFRMDWLDLLAVQGTLKSLLQHHSSKASILQHSASL